MFRHLLKHRERFTTKLGLTNSTSCQRWIPWNMNERHGIGTQEGLTEMGLGRKEFRKS